MIRPATDKDLGVILEVTNHTILTSNAIYEEEIWSEEKVNTWYQTRIKDGFPVFVYEHENQTVGFATYSKFRSRFGYRFTVEHSVYVQDGFHGKGIGSKLLNYLTADAKNEGYKQMIGVVDATNSQSIEFHKKHGFIESGTLTNVGNRFDSWLSITFLQKSL